MTQKELTQPGGLKGNHAPVGSRSRLAGSITSLLLPLAPLLLTIAVFGAWNPRLLSIGSVALIMNTLAFVGIVCIGQTILVVAGEFDLSVGAVAALAGYLAADVIVSQGLPFGLGIAAALLVGVTAGLLNGLITTVLKVPSFIATFGMLSICAGITGFYSRGESIFPIPPELKAIGKLSLGPFALITILFLILVVLSEVMLRRTRYGRHLLAVGSNPETAAILGIRAGRVKTIAFTLVGGLAGVAGLLQMLSLGAGNPSVGASWPLLSIAAVAIGGTSLFGGSGSVLGTLIGVVTLQTISNGIVSVGLDTNWQTFAIGVLMVSIVAIDILRRRRLAVK